MSSEYGFEKERFLNLTTDNFDCIICTLVARDPKDCSNCGNVFCSSCIDDWIKKKNECPNRCPKNEAKIAPVQRALKKIYSELKIKCEYCQKAMEIPDLDKHEKTCKLPKCINHEICGNTLGDDKECLENKVCDLSCLLLSRVKLAQTKEHLYQCIKNFVKEKQLVIAQQPVQQLNQGPVQAVQLQGNLPVFKWDKARVGTGIVCEADGAIFLREQAYMFRTAIAEYGYTGGCNYWEIVADERTENELKIGVCSKQNFNYNTAFCDFEYGWAYYGLGQLRHNSNATGQSFGKRFKKEGVLGVYLNMNKGTLSFSLNKELMGTAFVDGNLKKGPLYPAVSLLHCAGCKIVTGKPAPAIFDNC